MDKHIITIPVSQILPADMAVLRWVASALNPAWTYYAVHYNAADNRLEATDGFRAHVAGLAERGPLKDVLGLGEVSRYIQVGKEAVTILEKTDQYPNLSRIIPDTSSWTCLEHEAPRKKGLADTFYPSVLVRIGRALNYRFLQDAMPASGPLAGLRWRSYHSPKADDRLPVVFGYRELQAIVMPLDLSKSEVK